MAPLTLDQARKVLAATKGWADADGFVRVYEAMLRTHGWSDQQVRDAEVDRVRLQFVAAPVAPRLQVVSALERFGPESFTARQILNLCRPVASAQVTVALDGLTEEGSLERVGPGRRWRKATAPLAARPVGPLVPPLLETAQRVWHAWGTGDVETVIAHCRDDIVLRPSAPLPTAVGHDGLRAFYAGRAERPNPWSATVRRWTQQGEDVLICALARQRAPAGAYDADAVWLYRFRGRELALIQMM